MAAEGLEDVHRRPVDDGDDELLSWRHTGFAVHNSVTVYPFATAAVRRLACYLLRSPVSLERLASSPGEEKVSYQPKPGHDLAEVEELDPREFVARLLIHIPAPRKHLVRYFR